MSKLTLISLAVIAYIVPVLLSCLTIKADKKTTDSIENFEMRPITDISKIGWLVAGFFLFCIIGSSSAEQFEGVTAGIFVVLFALGIFLILAPTRGFWDVVVRDDKVTSSRLWIFKKHINIKDIDYCQLGAGGYHVYVKGKRGKALSIDGMSNNTDNWEVLMEREGIEIRMSKN